MSSSHLSGNRRCSSTLFGLGRHVGTRARAQVVGLRGNRGLAKVRDLTADVCVARAQSLLFLLTASQDSVSDLTHFFPLEQILIYYIYKNGS